MVHAGRVASNNTRVLAEVALDLSKHILVRRHVQSLVVGATQVTVSFHLSIGLN